MDIIKGPILLKPDNFTPLTRTPWAGYDIYQRYKKHLPHIKHQHAIGESWEFSCDPQYPSKLQETEEDLPHLMELFGEQILSKNLAQASPNCEILVKLINASTPLSLQVHPYDDDPNLAPNECGKPESWLILHAENGAGIYLGFKHPISKLALASMLKEQADVKNLLQFIPVKSGDYFEIMPGVPHAIGPGVTLLEPQRIIFNKSGKTYRMWDWNRLYDDMGNESVNGKPRQLHIEESLRIIDPTAQVGQPFLAEIIKQPQKTSIGPGAQWVTYPPNAYYKTSLLNLKKEALVSAQLKNGYAALIALEGDFTLTGQSSKTYSIVYGQSALLPNSGGPFQFKATSNCLCAIIIPSNTEWHWQKVR